jgi:hypothetical protein
VNSSAPRLAAFGETHLVEVDPDDVGSRRGLEGVSPVDEVEHDLPDRLRGIRLAGFRSSARLRGVGDDAENRGHRFDLRARDHPPGGDRYR